MCPSTQSCAVLIIFIQPFPSHPGGGTGFPLLWLVLSPNEAHQVSSASICNSWPRVMLQFLLSHPSIHPSTAGER